ncbi:1,4-dihydroxy-6-naphthoate synthase [Geoalkalibacter halelectricus]|uniref:1,4-dihydroxy-6-naphtoate synthase n=1 Tax=Geoalkalibacter halelectricus TaxID=2847045 RepID=A0ABY5ZJ61_9BACT|nr:1,4-dihydroxy-6-naphthoate synthase [Geoalkalibacter halelectricus]MDO3378253.1 1,4-dihydroxy-6-naphthoate synthase [Geoalkalibacter halelectricus]UWZ79156.1 1,4-dihydroxy-6-naphthoate synthase [Geoalkalibacter halelectricus]
MNRILSLGYSPCPNDTFIFYALVHGRVKLPAIGIRERLEDVETLNQLARAGQLDLTKISYHALGHLRERYALLRSGGALGRGCGPLVVAPGALDMAGLRGKRIAVPGRLTTANLLLQLYGSGYENLEIMPFDQILAAVAQDRVDAGVIIHESRFTYAEHGLTAVEDLGAWWERQTGLPIPLGGILARRDLGPELIGQVEEGIRRSLAYAYAHPREPRAYIRSHAQELSDAVIDSHIALYVNDFSLELGAEGEEAVRELLRRAEMRGLIPSCSLPLFV